MTTNYMTLSIIAAATAASLAVGHADAAQYTRSGSYITGSGKTSTYQRSIERSPGAVSRQGSISTQEGRTYSRSMFGTYDRGTGAVNRSVTGPDGRTRTATGTYDQGTHTYARTIVGPNGRQTQATTVYDRDSRSASSTYVGPHGKTSTGTTKYDAADRGFDTTVTGPDGRTYTRSSSNSYDRGTGTLTKSMTGLDGEVRTVDITPDRNN
jgi:hypothetical protein